MNIAVIVDGGLTETLQATPLLRTLRAGLPRSRIVLVCPSTAVDVAECVPPVDRVLGLAGLRGARGGGVALWSALRRMRLDTVVLCSTAVGPAVSAYLAGIPTRLGIRHGLNSVLFTASARPAEAESRAQMWLRLAGLLDIRQRLNAPVFEPGPLSRRSADGIVHESGLADGRLLVALVPGTGYAEPDTIPVAGAAWDPERWAHLANQLAVRHGAGIVLLGSPMDRPTIERAKVDLRAPVLDLASDLDLGVVAGVIARCDLLVGGDTPMLQLAAAMGTPSVGLFGPTDGRRRGPHGPDHRVLQALPSHTPNGRWPEPAMDRIRVEDVLAAVEAGF